MNTTALDHIITEGYRQSEQGTRTGDTETELTAIRSYIRTAE